MSRKRRHELSDDWYPGAGLGTQDSQKSTFDPTAPYSIEDRENSDKKRHVASFLTRTSLLFKDLEVG
jgi:hypothetical protein